MTPAERSRLVRLIGEWHDGDATPTEVLLATSVVTNYYDARDIILDQPNRPETLHEPFESIRRILAMSDDEAEAAVERVVAWLRGERADDD